MSTADRRPHYEAVAAEQITHHRLARGWSQSELARRMSEAGWPNYTQMTVSRTEKGERPIRLDELISYAEVFERPVAEMWLSDDEHAWQRSMAQADDAENALMNALHQYAIALQQIAYIADGLMRQGELPDERQARVRELLAEARPEDLAALMRQELREDQEARDSHLVASGNDARKLVTKRLAGEFVHLWEDIYMAPQSAPSASDSNQDGESDAAPSA